MISFVPKYFEVSKGVQKLTNLYEFLMLKIYYVIFQKASN